MESSTGLPSLNRVVFESQVSMSLTEAGLLQDRMEMIVRLYAEHHNWATVKEKWHEERIHERGSRSSAQGIFRILKRRLQAGGKLLPSLNKLRTFIEECATEQAKAQLFYFYLIREDHLFRFTLHEVLRQQGLERDEWHLTTDRITSVLDRFKSEEGDKLSYADSTLHRWAQGFRSVLRDIGVLKGPYDKTGTVPNVDIIPAHLAAVYSWAREGNDWPSRPIGWIYLFQPVSYQEALLDRIQSTDWWETSRLRGQTVVTPVQEEVGSS